MVGSSGLPLVPAPYSCCSISLTMEVCFPVMLLLENVNQEKNKSTSDLCLNPSWSIRVSARWLFIDQVWMKEWMNTKEWMNRFLRKHICDRLTQNSLCKVGNCPGVPGTEGFWSEAMSVLHLEKNPPNRNEFVTLYTPNFLSTAVTVWREPRSEIFRSQVKAINSLEHRNA